MTFNIFDPLSEFGECSIEAEREGGSPLAASEQGFAWEFAAEKPTTTTTTSPEKPILSKTSNKDSKKRKEPTPDPNDTNAKEVKPPQKKPKAASQVQYCKNYNGKQDSCARGDGCRFIHSTEGVEERQRRTENKDNASPLQELINQEKLSRKLFMSPLPPSQGQNTKMLIADTMEQLLTQEGVPTKGGSVCIWIRIVEVKNYCFIEMRTPEMASSLAGKSLNINNTKCHIKRPAEYVPDTKFSKTPAISEKTSNTTKHRIFVAGLYDKIYFCTPSRVASLFSFFGPLKAIEHIKNHAFVEYKKPADAETAIRILNGNKYTGEGSKKPGNYMLEVRMAINSATVEK